MEEPELDERLKVFATASRVGATGTTVLTHLAAFILPCIGIEVLPNLVDADYGRTREA